VAYFGQFSGVFLHRAVLLQQSRGVRAVRRNVREATTASGTRGFVTVTMTAVTIRTKTAPCAVSSATIIMIRPHHSSTYVDAAYFADRVAWSVDRWRVCSTPQSLADAHY